MLNKAERARATPPGRNSVAEIRRKGGQSGAWILGVALLFAVTTGRASAQSLRMPTWFSDGMVLQTNGNLTKDGVGVARKEE